MAKKSSIEKNERRRKMAKQYAAASRAEGDRARQDQADGGALCGLAQACANCRATRRRPASATAAR